MPRSPGLCQRRHGARDRHPFQRVGSGLPGLVGEVGHQPEQRDFSQLRLRHHPNIASMVADPEHLIRGANSTGRTVVMSSTKAIDSYREAKPTGEQGLKQESTQQGK